MEKLLKRRELIAFFKNQKLKCTIKKGGANMFENMFNQNENVEEIIEDKTNEEEQPKIKEQHTQKPLTLEEARQNLEYQLLKNYLSSLKEDQQINFIKSQVNLNAKLKEQLLKALNLSE